MTKEQLVSALKQAVGGTPYGDSLVEEAAETYGDLENKDGWSMKDRLDTKIGVLKAYQQLHLETGRTAEAQAEATKIAVCEKALEAIENMTRTAEAQSNRR